MQLAKLNGYEVPIGANPRIIDLSTGRANPYTPLIKQLRMSASPKPSLTALLDRFIDNPNKIRADKTKASIRGYMLVVIEILGDDTPVEEISEADCERVRDLIMKLPPNFSKLKALKNRPIEEMVRIANAHNMPKLSPTGVNNYIRWLNTFLNWCQKKGMIDRVPIAFSEIKVADPVRKEDKRLPFTNDQLNTIIHSRVFVEQERSRGLFWVFLIALWNGMRSNEICQLDAADVKQFEPSPVCRRLQSKYGWNLWKKVTEQIDFRLKCAPALFG
jgi:integrase